MGISKKRKEREPSIDSQDPLLTALEKRSLQNLYLKETFGQISSVANVKAEMARTARKGELIQEQTLILEQAGWFYFQLKESITENKIRKNVKDFFSQIEDETARGERIKEIYRNLKSLNLTKIQDIPLATYLPENYLRILNPDQYDSSSLSQLDYLNVVKDEKWTIENLFSSRKIPALNEIEALLFPGREIQVKNDMRSQRRRLSRYKTSEVRHGDLDLQRWPTPRTEESDGGKRKRRTTIKKRKRKSVRFFH